MAEVDGTSPLTLVPAGPARFENLVAMDLFKWVHFDVSRRADIVQ